MKSDGYPGKYGPLPEATPCNQSELIKALGGTSSDEDQPYCKQCGGAETIHCGIGIGAGDKYWCPLCGNTWIG